MNHEHDKNHHQDHDHHNEHKNEGKCAEKHHGKECDCGCAHTNECSCNHQ